MFTNTEIAIRGNLWRDKKIKPENLSHYFEVGEHFSRRECEDYAIVGYLHDIVEDGVWSMDLITQASYLSMEQKRAIGKLTRPAPVRYEDYIKMVAIDKMSTIVKLADLEDNINRCISQLLNKGEENTLLKRYTKAYAYLFKVCNDNYWTI